MNEIVILPIHAKAGFTYMLSELSTPHTLYAIKLWIVNVDTKTKVLRSVGLKDTV